MGLSRRRVFFYFKMSKGGGETAPFVPSSPSSILLNILRLYFKDTCKQRGVLPAVLAAGTTS